MSREATEQPVAEAKSGRKDKKIKIKGQFRRSVNKTDRIIETR